MLYEGQLQAQGFKFTIIVSRFNAHITTALLGGAVDCLKRHGALEAYIDTVWVPGAFELPLAAQKVAQSKRPDAIICLGAVIRGATPHFDYVCSEAAKGIGAVALKENLPVIFGVLTTESIEQAIERAGTKSGNKGWDSAMTAIEMVSLLQSL